jgi:GntR family transcriptional regulator
LFTLHPESGVPIYRQLVEQIRRLIAGGQLLPGAELPSVRELAVEHTVNPMTISKAYSLLEAEGLLERHRGRPMTVAAGRRLQVSLSQRIKQLDPQAAQLVTAARQLELSEKDLIALIQRQWEQDND